MIAWIRRLVHGADSAEPTASEKALDRTRAARREAEARNPDVKAAAAPFRRAREENHWAERIQAAYAARRGAAP